MKTIIAGGRDYQPTLESFAAITKIHKDHPISLVISGACRCKDNDDPQIASGADGVGETWAACLGIDLRRFTVTKYHWERYGKEAGPRRNKAMSEHAEALIVFPGGSGTQSMVNIAKERGLTIFDLRKS